VHGFYIFQERHKRELAQCVFVLSDSDAIEDVAEQSGEIERHTYLDYIQSEYEANEEKA